MENAHLASGNKTGSHVICKGQLNEKQRTDTEKITKNLLLGEVLAQEKGR